MYQNKKQCIIVSQRKFFSGFSLVEAIVAMGVFSIVMVAVSVAFSGGFAAHKNTVMSQKYIENAQYIMNDLTKQLRTSSVLYPTGNPANNTNPVSIKFFDHSQSKCVMYRQHVSPDYIEKAIGAAGTEDECDEDPDFIDFDQVTTGEVTMDLEIRNSVLNSRAGKVTISFWIGGGDSSHVEPVLLQSAVSLRDYKKFLGL